MRGGGGGGDGCGGGDAALDAAVRRLEGNVAAVDAALRGLAPARCRPDKSRPVGSTDGDAAAPETGSGGSGSPNKGGKGAVLGWAVSIGAGVARLPQIAKIIGSGSVDGLDPAMFQADAFCNAVSALYHRSKGYPVNTYGETVAFSVQSIATVALMARFSATRGARRRAAGFIMAYFALVGATLRHERAAQPTLDRAQRYSMMGLQLSRVPQIIRNQTTGSTGQLSIVPWLVNLLGSSARLITTLTQLGGNRLLLANFSTSIFINGLMALQIARIGNNTLTTELAK